MKKKILVTGCAGFIGSHLCEKLISKTLKRPMVSYSERSLFRKKTFEYQVTAYTDDF